MIEQTLVLVKPDGLVRSLTGNILTRLSETKLEIVAAKICRVSRELAEAHYEHLKDKPFYDELLRYICGEVHGVESIVALVYFGPDAIVKVRQLAGATNPEQAESTSIRGAFGRLTTSGLMENVLHASSDGQEAEREIKLWFRPEELLMPLYPTKIQASTNHKLAVWA